MMLATAAAFAIMAAPGNSQLDNFVSALQGAQALNVSYKLTEVGGATRNYTINLAKPNKARIETPDKVYVADGKNLTVLMKKDNAYVVKPQGSLDSLFDEFGVGIWLPFFNAKAFEGLSSAKDGGERNWRGDKYSIVNAVADAKGDFKMTFFLKSDDKIARQVQFVTKTLSGEITSILTAESLNLTPGSGDLFAFNAPAGSKQIDEADLKAGQWLVFEEAVKVAQATGRMIMVDFMATWCGPCKMMDAQVFQTDQFKKGTGDLVLTKVDVDQRKDLASRFGVSAMPTVKFLKPNLSIVHEFVGYGGPAAVYREIDTARGKFRN